jgi:signal transduction histidine kinase
MAVMLVHRYLEMVTTKLCSTDELRTLFLFEKLTDAQLDWLCQRGAGTGLGLDITWRIVVNKHHGDVRLDSVPGNTRFQVRLPVTDQNRVRE